MRSTQVGRVASVVLLAALVGCASSESDRQDSAPTSQPASASGATDAAAASESEGQESSAGAEADAKEPAVGAEQRRTNPNLRVTVARGEDADNVNVKRGRQCFANYSVISKLTDMDVRPFRVDDATYERMRDLAFGILKTPPSKEGEGRLIDVSLLMLPEDRAARGLERSSWIFPHRPGEREDVDELLRLVEGLLDEHRPE